MVKAQKLEMRLIHITDGPLVELKEFVMAQGSGAGGLSNPFASTDQDVINDIKRTFKRFEKAKIEFDAPIVPNIGLIDNVSRKAQ